MPPTPARKLLPAYLGLLLIAVLLAERLSRLARLGPTDFDDAYMFLRYALHLLDGQGLAWNAGEGSVFGVTSLLHLVVVTALRGLGPGLSPAAVLGAASGGAALGLLAALVAMLALCARHPRLHGNWPFWAAVLLPIVAYREAFVFHAGTGMDTMLAAAANAFVAFATLRLLVAPTPRAVLGAAVAAWVAVLARPDNLLCALLGPGLALGLMAARPRGRRLALFAATAGGGVALLVLGAWLFLGSLVPLAFFAKQPWFYGGFAGEFAWNPFRFLEVFAYSAWPFVAALLLFADRAGLRRAVVLLGPALLSLALLFRFNQVMGHLGRFSYPFLPFFVAAGALEFDAWLDRVRRGRAPSRRMMLARAGLTGLALLAGGIGLSAGAAVYDARAASQHLEPPGGYRVAAAEPLPELDSWEAAHAIAALAAAAPAGARLAMSEHGLPGALAPQVAIIDVLGLHDPHVARNGFSAAELFRREPDLIWLPHGDHTQMLRDILGSEDFWAHYAFYPDAFFHGLALRADGPHHERLRVLVAEAWAVSYPGVDMAAHRAARAE